jgi:hypothetical protein
MTIEYYHLSPVIMDDDLYTEFGGRLANSTAPQRQAAYLIGEIEMMRELSTFLLPTTVTGTFLSHGLTSKRIQLPSVHLISVEDVTYLSHESGCNCDIKKDSGCAYIVDSMYGYIDAKRLTSTLVACGCNIPLPYQFQVAYTAGLPTGVAADDSALHLALTIVSELALLEIVDPKALEGGPGGQGVQEWVSMGYGEKRTKLQMTVFGSSPRANRAWRLVQHLTPKRAMKLGL